MTDMGGIMTDFDPDAVSKRLGNLEFDVQVAYDRLYEASPWLARQWIAKQEEKFSNNPARYAHRVVT
jgi:hypothetical protein